MSWAPSFIVDGETPGVSKINTVFTGFRTYVNALDRSAIKLNALNVNQVPSIIPSGSPDVIEHHSTTGPHTYSDTTFGVSIRYTTHGNNGASYLTGLYAGFDRLLIGHPDQGGGVSAPQAVVNLNGGSGHNVGNNGTDNVSFILAMFNVDVVNVVDTTTDVDVMVCLQFKHSGSATYYTLPKTERFVSRDDRKIDGTDPLERMWFDVPIRTIIGEDQLTAVGGDPATDKITQVRAVCSLKSGTVGGSTLQLGSFRLSAVPILASLS